MLRIYLNQFRKKLSQLMNKANLEAKYTEYSCEIMFLGDSECNAGNIKGALFLYDKTVDTDNLEKWRPNLYESPIEHYLSDRVSDLGEYQLAVRYAEAAVKTGI